jgi:hypothetical protein
VVTVRIDPMSREYETDPIVDFVSYKNIYISTLIKVVDKSTKLIISEPKHFMFLGAPLWSEMIKVIDLHLHFPGLCFCLK